MQMIHIIRNPFMNTIRYEFKSNDDINWTPIDSVHNPNSLLVSESFSNGLVRREIIDVLLSEYVIGDESLEIMFSGTNEDYEFLSGICKEYSNVHLSRSVFCFIDYDVVSPVAAKSLNILVSSEVGDETKIRAFNYLDKIQAGSECTVIGEAFVFLEGFLDSVVDLDGVYTNKISLLRTKIGSWGNSAEVSFRTKLVDDADQIIDKIQLNCSEDIVSRINGMVTFQTASTVKVLYDEALNAEKSNNDSFSSYKKSLFSSLKESKTEKSLRKSLEVERDKRIQNYVLDSLIKQQKTMNQSVIPTLTDLIEDYFNGRVSLITSSVQTTISKFGNALFQDRMREVSNEINNITTAYRETSNSSCSLLDNTSLIYKSKLADVYNNSLKKFYTEFVADYSKQVASDLKKELKEILELIADIDSESDPIIGKQISEMNTYRSKQIQNGILINHLSPQVAILQNLIDITRK